MSTEQFGAPSFEPVKKTENKTEKTNRVIALREENINLIIGLKGKVEVQNSKYIELASSLALMISAKKTSTKEFALLREKFEEIERDYNENKLLLNELIEKVELDIEPTI